MKTEKNILIAFILNFGFSIFEFIGGVFTGSVAIISDAVHDIGDAVSIGISYFLEKKSRKAPDEKSAYGYARYSVIGSATTTMILLAGSVIVIFNAVGRVIKPVEINYNGMILFAIIGVFVNSIAAFFTHGGESLNEKAVNLHMLEDVFGWGVVLVGAVVIRFTDIYYIDPIMSIGVAVFIIFNAIKNLKEIIDIFLEKAPCYININEIKERVLEIDGVSDVHHIHIWSMDGEMNYATMHIVTYSDSKEIKAKVRDELYKNKISHTTLEIEKIGEDCSQKNCYVPFHKESHKHHHY